MLKDYFLDSDDKSLRGSAINASITLSIFGVIIYGLLFNDTVVDRINKIGFFILQFFGISFGIWAAKKHMDYRVDQSSPPPPIPMAPPPPNSIPMAPPPPNSAPTPRISGGWAVEEPKERK